MTTTTKTIRTVNGVASEEVTKNVRVTGEEDQLNDDQLDAALTQ